MKKSMIFIISLLCLFLLLTSCDTAVGERETAKPTHVHTFEEWRTVTEASCTQEGLMIRKCSDCDHQEKHTVEKLPHTLSETVINPTCEAQGYTLYTCVCGYSHKSDFIKPLGHTLTEEVTEATCTTAGLTHYKCQSCDYEYDGNFVAPLAHANSTGELYYPTVKQSGYTLYTCPDCEHTYKADYVSYSDICSGAYVENAQVLERGIDTSKHNHKTGLTSDDLLPIDWAGLKALGVDYVILRAGTSLGKDPAFEADYAAAKEAGLKVGAYFYAYSTTVGGTVKDAHSMLEWIEGKQFEYPIYFDIEDPSLETLAGDHLTEICFAFAEVLQTNGYYCGMYLNNEWLTRLLDTEKIVESFDVWYARYPLDGTPAPWELQEFAWDESYGQNVGMWQYTRNGIFTDYHGEFDLSFAYKDYAALMVALGLNGF